MKNPDIVQLDFGFNIKPVANQKIKPKTPKKAKEDFVFEFMDYLTSPIVVFPSAWMHDIPKEVLQNITMSRMLCQLSGEKMASYAEVVAYIMPRTFESPMPSEWVRIYAWSCLQYVKQFRNAETVEFAKQNAPEELTDYEMGLLNGLRKWIYEKRRKALKERLKRDKSSNAEKVDTLKQESLFDK